jgi:hypothetical protein
MAAAGVSTMEQFQSFFFVIGLVVVMTYAWQRFNEPSFPQREDLPRTVEPLRYLFMRSTYGKARIGYVAGLMVLYALLVAPGPTMVETLGQAGIKDFPPKAWPLLIALVLTSLGTVPASLKWLNVIEEWLRQWVHSWFLVPDGMKRTIGVLEDARYDPPPSQLNLVENTATRERLQENLNAPTGTLRYRWARTAVLMVSLRQMGAGAPHPLARAAFAPFEEDFKAILASYRGLRPDVEALLGNPMGGGDAEENLLASVDSLLRRIYTYISWGLLQQADHEGDIDQTLEELGFRIPKTRGRRLADIVVPAVLPVALITMAFWVFLDAGRWMMGWDAGKQTSDVVLDALSSAIAAAVMYGAAVFIALKGRATQIEEKTWRDGSARCLIPIALKAGLVTWGVIVAVAVIYDFSQISRSLIAMVQGAKLFISGAPADATTDGWDVLWNNVVTALPWMLVGGTTIIAPCLRSCSAATCAAPTGPSGFVKQ